MAPEVTTNFPDAAVDHYFVIRRESVPEDIAADFNLTPSDRVYCVIFDDSDLGVVKAYVEGQPMDPGEALIILKGPCVGMKLCNAGGLPNAG